MFQIKATVTEFFSETRLENLQEHLKGDTFPVKKLLEGFQKFREFILLEFCAQSG